MRQLLLSLVALSVFSCAWADDEVIVKKNNSHINKPKTVEKINKVNAVERKIFIGQVSYLDKIIILKPYSSELLEQVFPNNSYNEKNSLSFFNLAIYENDLSAEDVSQLQFKCGQNQICKITANVILNNNNKSYTLKKLRYIDVLAENN